MHWCWKVCSEHYGYACWTGNLQPREVLDRLELYVESNSAFSLVLRASWVDTGTMKQNILLVMLFNLSSHIPPSWTSGLWGTIFLKHQELFRAKRRSCCYFGILKSHTKRARFNYDCQLVGFVLDLIKFLLVVGWFWFKEGFELAFELSYFCDSTKDQILKYEEAFSCSVV